MTKVEYEVIYLNLEECFIHRPPVSSHSYAILNILVVICICLHAATMCVSDETRRKDWPGARTQCKRKTGLFGRF